MDLYVTLLVAALLAGLATIIKYFGGEGMIAGYNTASPAEQKYMSEKGIGAFIGNYLYLLAGIMLAGFLSKKAGLAWGEDVSWILFAVVIIIMVIRAQRFNPPASLSTPQSFRVQKIGLLLGVIITLAVAGLITWTALPSHFNLEADQLKISGAYGINLNYSDIDDISLQTEMPAVGMKINGLGWGSILKGYFEVQGMGSARLFLRSSQGPVIIITFKDRSNPVLINFSDPAETTRLYQQLKSQII